MTLSRTQTDDLRGRIEGRRRQLLQEVRDDLARLRADRFEDIAGDVSDRGDESVAALIAELDRADASRDVNELRGLEAARERIAEGRYGVCGECGGDIGYERLKAEPSAVRCIECQRRHEKTFAGPGGASL